MTRVSTYLFAILLFAGCQNNNIDDSSTVIANVDIIDPSSGLIKNQSVVINENIIKSVQSADEINLKNYFNVIDASGKYMTPGLWDAHVHFAYIEELAPSMFDLFMAYGITSVRDTGGKIEFVKKWKDMADADPQNAPRVKIAGPLLDGTPNVYDGSTPSKPPLSVGLATAADAANMVEYMDSMEVDLLKAYEMLTPEQFGAIMIKAKEKGLKVTGHIPLSMDVITASNLGLNSVEHMRNLELSCAANWEELLTDRRNMLRAGKDDTGGILRSRIHAAQRPKALRNQDPEQTKKVLAALAKNETWQIPTMAIMTAMVKRHFARPDWLKTFDYLPTEIGNRWASGVEEISKSEISEDAQLYTDWQFNIVAQIKDANIGIMAGTDCPIFFLTPGYSLHEELALLVEAGLSPLEAIRAATTKPAEYFDIQDELGLVKDGFIADLLLLDANPLEDIRNSTKINTVIKDGKVHNREALDKMLNDLESSSEEPPSLSMK